MAEPNPLHQDKRHVIDDTAIRALVTRLSRPHPSGGCVIERAAILAEGAEAGIVYAWIEDHGGQAEMAPVTAGRGLYSDRIDTQNSLASATPRRYVLPAGVLDEVT
jgi:hypothetical protein